MEEIIQVERLSASPLWHCITVHNAFYEIERVSEVNVNGVSTIYCMYYAMWSGFNRLTKKRQ